MDADAPLPEIIRPFFWDYPNTALSLREDRALIIGRILAGGTWEAITWLRRQVGDEALKEWMFAHQGRGLSPRQLRFWELVLDLPEEQVDAWVQAALQNPWGKR